MADSKPFDFKIGIGTPEMGEVKAGTAHSLISAVNYFLGIPHEGEKEITPLFVSSSMLTESRHKIVLEALKHDCTHLLWMDSDMTFPMDAIWLLLKHNVPIVGVNYARRGLPTRPTAAKDGKVFYTEPEDEGLVEVDHLGFGLMMTDIRLYHGLIRDDGKLDMPLFMFEPKEDLTGLIGEDVYFCKKIKKHFPDMPIYCDQSLSQAIGHIGEMPFTHSHALECRKQGVYTQEDMVRKIKDSAA